MRITRLVPLFAGLVLLSSTSSTLLAQDGMKAGAMADSGKKAGAMADDKMDHGMMMKEEMAPHAMFTGANKHTVSGGFHIATEGGKQSLVLDSTFVLDGAPDPYIVLSADEMGTGKGTLNLGRLQQKKGSSTFTIPAGTDLAQFHNVLVYCKKYNVTLGSAELAAGGKMMHN